MIHDALGDVGSSVIRRPDDFEGGVVASLS